jgi:hypothetical protein
MKKLKFLIDGLLKQDPYLIKKSNKKKILLKIFKSQIKYHKKKCSTYNLWYKKNNFLDTSKIKKVSDIPFLPSSIFKNHDLKSISSKYKIIQSSGSSGNKSNIYIDKTTSMLQRQALTKILTKVIGKKRKKFFIVDLPILNSVNKIKLTARNAGMAGYLMAAKDTIYLLKLNKNNEIILDLKALDILQNLASKENFIIIGYTYMIWKHICNNKKFKNLNLKFKKDTKLIHFGGWKKIETFINKDNFYKALQGKLNININSILDIYGFSEQLGSIYYSKGNSGNIVNGYSEVLVRDFDSLKIVKDGKVGFLQFLSALPISYPGFSILNDDIGYISKRRIKSGFEHVEFKTLNRLDRLEPRGCGDTLPKNFYV